MIVEFAQVIFQIPCREGYCCGISDVEVIAGDYIKPLLRKELDMKPHVSKQVSAQLHYMPRRLYTRAKPNFDGVGVWRRISVS
jgi:hypothetical protein